MPAAIATPCVRNCRRGKARDETPERGNGGLLLAGIAFAAGLPLAARGHRQAAGHYEKLDGLCWYPVLSALTTTHLRIFLAAFDPPAADTASGVGDHR